MSYTGIVVPDHCELDHGTLRSIIKDSDLSIEDFTKNLSNFNFHYQLHADSDFKEVDSQYFYFCINRNKIFEFMLRI